MRDELFFDTNIIAYAFDVFDPKKKEICEELINKAFKGDIVAYVSNQILGELFSVLTQKMGKPITKDIASTIIESIIDSEKWIKINYGHETIKRVLKLIRNINITFWDALIAETMKENGIVKIFTENEEDFKKIPGIEAINPIKNL